MDGSRHLSVHMTDEEDMVDMLDMVTVLVWVLDLGVYLGTPCRAGQYQTW